MPTVDVKVNERQSIDNVFPSIGRRIHKQSVRELIYLVRVCELCGDYGGIRADATVYCELRTNGIS